VNLTASPGIVFDLETSLGVYALIVPVYLLHLFLQVACPARPNGALKLPYTSSEKCVRNVPIATR
jgi:hypothetical protein